MTHLISLRLTLEECYSITEWLTSDIGPLTASLDVGMLLAQFDSLLQHISDFAEFLCLLYYERGWLTYK